MKNKTNPATDREGIKLSVARHNALLAVAKLAGSMNKGHIAKDHTKLADLLEDEDAENDAIRAAAIEVCASLEILRDMASKALATK